ncbi:MAG: DUF4349 domain-containing protein [Coriobacteriia bacterium]|nr:DUF4349 domain-containing protein [Coriobacteriia bacterium]MBN2841323.1 DUF4349 domain-containing protein [Coriobacteriia bacterium]
MSTIPRSYRTTLVLLALTVAAAAMVGCSAASESATDVAAEEYGVAGVASDPTAPATRDGVADEAAGPDSVESKQAPDADRMVIRNKTLRLEVESTPDAVERIRALVKTHDGTIQDLQVATDTDEWLYRYDEYGYATGDGAALRGWVTVRVPAASFEAFVDEAIALGTLRFQAEDSEDVTQQHVDLTARLANLRAEEERLRTFFDAAKDVEDMLAIETELNRVRQEIESLDAQVTYLERQAAMATITIELTEPRPVVRPAGDDWGFRDAITSGFRGAADVVTFLIAAVIGTAPLWILAIIALVIVRAVLRSRTKKQMAAAARAAQQAAPQAPDASADAQL